jgi:ATP-binding cassette, subfamily C, bacterial CydD
MPRHSSDDPARRALDALEKTSRRPILAAAVLASAASLLWIVQAYVAADLIGALVAGTATVEKAVFAAGLFVGFGLLRHGGEAYAARRAFRAAQTVVADERRWIIDRESLVSPLASNRQSSAALATLVGNKLELLIPWMARYRVAAIKVAVVPLVILAAALLWSWAAALILLMSGPLIPLFMALIGFAARDASEKHLAETGTLNGLLLEWLTAAFVIRLLNAEAATLARFETAADSLRARTMAVLRVAFLSSTVLELFAALGIALAAVYVGFSLLGTFSFGTYGTPLSVAGGIFILLLVPDFFLPMRELAAAWHDRAAALAVAGEVAALEQGTVQTMLGTGRKRPASHGAPAIRAENVGLAMSAGRHIRFPDFVVEPGDKIALTGSSGAGKSTLLYLLAGLAKPDQGSLTVAGQRLDDDTADAWRARIGYVGQHPHLLNASVRANLALAETHADPGRLSAALDKAQASDVVAGLPRGADTRLGENGAGVSGGEARRLMIARAIYANADVILADEPTADLDAMTAARITDALLAAAETGATLIVATHDPALIARMDREIRLEARS